MTTKLWNDMTYSIRVFQTKKSNRGEGRGANTGPDPVRMSKYKHATRLHLIVHEMSVKPLLRSQAISNDTVDKPH